MNTKYVVEWRVEVENKSSSYGVEGWHTDADARTNAGVPFDPSYGPKVRECSLCESFFG